MAGGGKVAGFARDYDIGLDCVCGSRRSIGTAYRSCAMMSFVISRVFMIMLRYELLPGMISYRSGGGCEREIKSLLSLFHREYCTG